MLETESSKVIVVFEDSSSYLIELMVQDYYFWAALEPVKMIFVLYFCIAQEGAITLENFHFRPCADPTSVFPSQKNKKQNSWKLLKMAAATVVGLDAHRMEEKKLEYFSSINSMAKKIMEEREKIKTKYGPSWEQMTQQEQDNAIDNCMMDPHIRARYAMHKVDREEVVCYPKLLIQTGQKIVHFGEEVLKHGLSCRCSFNRLCSQSLWLLSERSLLTVAT